MSTASDQYVAGDGGQAVFADDAAAALLREHVGELRRPDGRWQLVKQNASRTIWRGQVGGRNLYLKHFHGRAASQRLASLVGRGLARKEFEAALRLQRAGVPTIPVLARLDGSPAALASDAVEPATPGNVWHRRQLAAGPSGRRAIRRASVALAELVARMHAAGISHEDLHCGNILVRDGDGHELVLTDLHRIRRGRLSRRRRAMNLAQLLHDRLEATTRTERLRFLRRYIEASGAGGTLRGWQTLVDALGRRHRRRQLAHLDRRVHGCNKYFTRLRVGKWDADVLLALKRPPEASTIASTVFTADQWRQALADPAALLQGGQVVEDSPSRLVIARRLSVGEREIDVLVHRPRRRSILAGVSGCLCSHARRLFRRGHKLLHRRVATAVPLACIERRVGPIVRELILITEAVEGLPLDRFMEAVLVPRPDGDLPMHQRRQLAQEVLWQLGHMLRRLHDSNFAHRELTEKNILVNWACGRGEGVSPSAAFDEEEQEREQDAPATHGQDARATQGQDALATSQRPHVVLLNLDGLRRVRRMTTRRRFEGLMRLNVSLLRCPAVNRAGRLRMLLGYLRRPGAGRIDFKPYWRVLEDWSSQQIRRHISTQRRRQKAIRITSAPEASR